MSADNSESFRSEITARLLASMPQDQVINVLAVLDTTMHDYDISRKPVSLITSDGIPDVVKYFIASKAVENLSRNTLKIYRLRLTDFFTMVKKPFQDIRANELISFITRRSADPPTLILIISDGF